MRKHGVGKHLRVAFAVLCGCLAFSPPVRQLVDAPGAIDLPLGQGTTLSVGLLTHVQAISSDQHVVRVQPARTARHEPATISVLSHDLGDATVRTRLFGMIPWKAVRVHVVPQDLVYVGGQSIGVNLHTTGVIVVGYQLVGGARSPAATAHVQIGDVIEQVDGRLLHGSADLLRSVQASQGPMHLLIRRGNTHLTLDLAPVADDLGGRHLGLYVRDKAAGVGTLTFYEPLHHRFGALGHVITDADTGQPIVGTGAIYGADVTGMVKGRAGQPGEKRGRFLAGGPTLGEIEENTDFGVFGSMRATPPDALFARELPVALPSQVHDGAAQLLTVVHGHQVQTFTVQIETTQMQDRPETKSMVVHVTDPRLLRAAGGIVQGMSGSPLVQDGRLIGAVTHVFVSDPTRGYGVYAQWMLREAESGEEAADKPVSKFVALPVTSAESIRAILAGHTPGSSN